MRYYPCPPDPAIARAFHRDVLRQRPWSKQDEIRDAVFGGPHRTTCVASCTGAGKTKAAADIALTWLYTGPGRTVITTAPTARQVRDLLWKELRLTFAVARDAKGQMLGGHLPPEASTLKIEEGWLAVGFTARDPVSAQGWHSEGGTLAIIDEAVGVPEPIWESLEATLVGEHDRLLAVANPTARGSRFGSLWGMKGSVNCIQISAFDTPNLVEGRTVIPGMTTISWVEDKRLKWGTSSLLWRTKVLGEFPEEDDEGLCSLASIDRAVARWRETAGARPQGSDADAGLDVARFGDDKSVLAPIYWAPDGVVVGRMVKWAKANTMETVGKTRQLAEQMGISRVRVDGDGLGAGVFDRLQELGTPEVVEMRGGTRANDPRKFVNARSEWLWALREALADDAPTPLALPPDDDLIFQATSLRWRVNSRGYIQVESKDDWRERTKRSSPDELDAVAMALARGAGATSGVEPAYV